MSTNFAQHTSVKQTPQTQFIPGRESEMAKNNAGGAVFTIDCFTHLLRFLIIGTEGGTYYSTERKHTLQAFDSLRTCISKDAKKTVDMAVDVSVKGRAAKNDAALFTIACVMAFAKNPDDKFYARNGLDKVARIGTHILHFAEFINQLKGWGTGTRKAFKNWFLEKTEADIAYQYIKYGQRDGWSMRDLLRKAHPFGNESQNNVFQYIAQNGEGCDHLILPEIFEAYEKIGHASVKEAADLITKYRLPREALPTELLNEKRIWAALLPHMGLTAIIRNIGKMSNIGLVRPLSSETKFICEKLTNIDELRKARIHPINALNALKVYNLGHGLKGKLNWDSIGTISDALEFAFTNSFTHIEPSNKNVLLALDVSGSMSMSTIAGTAITPREGSAVMAMVTARAEKNYHFMAFSKGFIPLNISATDSYAEVTKKILGLPFERTDCSLPMLHAEAKKLDVDMFQVYTDNETYAGRMAPSQALKQYRKAMNKPNAKLAVVGMTATRFTIADPKDPLMLDFVGFDSNAPAAMAEFGKM